MVMPDDKSTQPRRERQNDQLTYLHDITSRKPAQIEYERRRRVEIEEEERESVFNSWNRMLVTAVIAGIPAGFALWFCEPIVRALALIAGTATTAFQYKSARTVQAQRRSFVFLLTTIIAGLSLLIFLQSL